jgi:hypothetical protein
VFLPGVDREDEICDIEGVLRTTSSVVLAIRVDRPYPPRRTTMPADVAT